MVVSDGDIFDEEKAAKKVDALLQFSPFATMDFVIIAKTPGPGDSKTKMQQMAEARQAANPTQEIGCLVSDKINEIPAGMLALLLDKIMHKKSFIAVDRREKMSAFRRAAQVMNYG
jgi:hypothetical protein